MVTFDFITKFNILAKEHHLHPSTWLASYLLHTLHTTSYLLLIYFMPLKNDLPTEFRGVPAVYCIYTPFH